MKKNSYEKFLKFLPQVFHVDFSLNNAESFFSLIKNMLNFKEGYIFLLNSENIQLKYANGDIKLKLEDVIDINKAVSTELFKKESLVLDRDSKIIKLLQLNNELYLLSKLAIKDTIFGFFIVGYENRNIEVSEKMLFLDVISNILAYKFKDLELSNVFKIQLRALKSAIEESNEANKVIKLQNKKIIAADKIKNEFLASVSHELRTPLNAIIGFSDILSSKVHGELNSKQLEYINDIQVAGVQLLGMVNEILDISKIEANAIKLIKRYFEISRPIIETGNILMPLIKHKNIDFKYEIENDIDIFADYQKIQQILYNLLSNAIKYTPESGNIFIKVTNTQKNVRISVKDSGIGIDKKDHKRIFGKFVQLEDAFYKKETSTGLGLTITKKLVEMHSGKIKVESERGNGANFIVTLPIESNYELQ